MVRRVGFTKLLVATVGAAAAVAGLTALPATAGTLTPSPMRSLPGVQQPVVLGPAPATPTVVGPASSPGARLHAADAPSTFVVNYDAGFNANPAAKAAFQAAVDEWSSVISSPVPITITATFTALPSGVLGSAGPTSLRANFTGAPQSNTWYPIALGNARHGSDLDATIPDISATFSSTFANFYFGTDGVPGSKVDFESVVLHELGHGLGFVGLAGYNGSAWSCCGGSSYPGIYDRFTTGNGSPIATMSAAALPIAMQGGDVRFTGATAASANGGVAPKLYAPNPWQGGSSYSHLDEATYPAGNPNSLMTPAIGFNEVIHAPGPITLGIFADSGWTTDTTPLPKLSISSARVVEGNSGTRRLRANVTLSDPVPWPVTATFATSNGTATAGSDYTAATGIVTIPAGATIATPSFVILPDRVAEAAEKFTVRLSAPTGAVLGTSATSLYILNDDPSSGVSISAGSASTVEGNSGDRLVSFTLSMSLVKTKTITVDWATGSGTATPGVDYDATGGTVTFAPGTAYARVQVLVHADTIHEGVETIPIVLSNSVGAPIARPTGPISITDDD